MGPRKYGRILSKNRDDAYDVASEVTHYTEPGDEDEMNIFRQMTGNPDLQVSDLTLGMYRASIENEFEK